MISVQEFLPVIRQKGWFRFQNILPGTLIGKINKDLATAYDTCRKIQIKNGIEANTDGTVHHLLGQGDNFLEVLRAGYLQEHMRAYFDNAYIINSYGGVINMKNRLSYVGNIHRDIRTFYNIPMMINMLVMLDDFTVDNGATYFLTGSHLKDEKPESDYFYSAAERATGKAGDIILFDSLLWHAAGENKTDNERRALTLTFTRPFMKQQLDYPRFLGYDKGDEFSEDLRQVLGYNARVPSNLDEWYQPPNKRFYRPGQG